MSEFVRQLSDLISRRVPDEIASWAVGRLVALQSKDDTTSVAAFDTRDFRLLERLAYYDTGPDIWVLVSLREDYLAQLQRVRAEIPLLFRRQMQLQLLTRDQAHKAIADPSRAQVSELEQFEFEHDAVERVLDYLEAQGEETADGDTGTIEPTQLQIICASLNARRMAAGRKKIGVSDLGGRRGLQGIIHGHYRNVLRSFKTLGLGWSGRRLRPEAGNWLVVHRPRIAIVRLCENVLITADGFRNFVSEGEIRRRCGVAANDLATLQNPPARLIRSEPRGQTLFYELIHDSLLAPLKRARELRKQVRYALLFLLFVPLFFVHELVEQYRQVITFVTTYDMRTRFESAADPDERSLLFREIAAIGWRDFSGWNLDETSLEGITLERATIAGTSFRKANLSRSNFIDVLGDQADFSEARLDNSAFRSSSFSGAKFGGGRLVGVRFESVDLSGADFSNASLREASFRKSNLTSITLGDNPELEGVRFVNSVFDGSEFEGTRWWRWEGWSEVDLARLFEKSPPSAYWSSPAFQMILEQNRQRLKQVEIEFSELHDRIQQAERDRPVGIDSQPTGRQHEKGPDHVQWLDEKVTPQINSILSTLDSAFWPEYIYEGYKPEVVVKTITDVLNRLDEALRRARGNGIGPENSEFKTLMDTRGSARLFACDFMGAIRDLERSFHSSNLKYRRAVALEAVGRVEEASKLFTELGAVSKAPLSTVSSPKKAETRTYTPTFERVFAPRIVLPNGTLRKNSNLRPVLASKKTKCEDNITFLR